jgi:hypothetical protein
MSVAMSRRPRLAALSILPFLAGAGRAAQGERILRQLDVQMRAAREGHIGDA